MFGQRLTLDIDIQAGDLIRAFLRAEGGIHQWNTLMTELCEIGLMEEIWDTERDEPMVIFGLFVENADLSGLQMPAINLSHVYMDGCRFCGCDLRGAEIGAARRCSFGGADLRGTVFGFYSDLTGADFTGAATDGATSIDRGAYDAGIPPKGLPGHLRARCVADRPEIRRPLPPGVAVPLKAAARLIIPPR